MRVVCNPLGIVLCILVWVCAVITNGVTVRFVLQPLFTFIDRPGASEASSWLWSLLDQTPERSPKDGSKDTSGRDVYRCFLDLQCVRGKARPVSQVVQCSDGGGAFSL